jgi:MlaD protein
VVAAGIVGLYYAQLPAVYLGIGRYAVKVEVDRAGDLYRAGNVTYRGVEVGKVSTVGRSPSATSMSTYTPSIPGDRGEPAGIERVEQLTDDPLQSGFVGR